MDLFPWDRVDSSWKEVLDGIFQIAEMRTLEKRVIEEYEKYTVYPPRHLIFNAFMLTPFKEIKVVIIGQDPYHGEGQAHGLCFSVPRGIQHPPSLVNIFKEIHNEYGMPIPESGDLTPWALQGVFLLNTVLTVRANSPGSHRNIGWQALTSTVIKKISDNLEGVVFMLWGKDAQSLERFIDKNKHYVLKAAHPSPLSSGNFLGCNHFWLCNEYLIKKGKTPINWAVE